MPIRLALLLAPTCAAVMAAGAAQAGEAQCWYENGAVRVAGGFGTITGDFIVDATAPKSLLHDDIAQGAGFADTHLTGDLRFAGMRLRRTPMEVESFNEREVGFPTETAGVIGADILSRFVVRIAFSPCRISFLDRPPRFGPDDRRLSLKLVGGLPAIQAVASDGTRDLKGLFAVDTASVGVRFVPNTITFSRPLADKVDPTLRFRPPARLHGLTLGPDLIENAPAGTAEYPLPGLDGAIGDAVWDRYVITLDIRRRRLDLEPTR